ncbi:MAG: DUF6600 domain-containing protein, partial [Vicinamibacteria bacterium]
FAPRVDDDWRPYTRGQWDYTDDGWYWDSDEDFGWATYHYGRWADDPRYGWIWIPGEEWAPAWVSWRQGNGYTGWAPLPPGARWSSRDGLQLGGLEIDASLGARDYNFVEDRHFVDRGIYQRIQPASINLTIINRTSNVTHYTTVNNRVYNRGVAIGDVERAVGRKVTELKTVDRNRHDQRGGDRNGQVAVFRPQVKISNNRKPSHGHSVVKGEAPPQALVERGQRRERGQSGAGPDGRVTARDAAQRGRDNSKPETRHPNAPAPPVVQPPPAPNRERARVQEQQRIDDAKRQGEQRQRDQQAEAARQQREAQPRPQPADHGRGNSGKQKGKPRPAATRPPDASRTEPRAQRQADQRQRDQAAQEAARQQQQNQAQQQQQAEREKAAAADQRQRGRQGQADRDQGKRPNKPPGQAEKAKHDPQDRKGPRPTPSPQA